MELRSNKKRKALSSSEQERAKSESIPRVIMNYPNGFIVEVLSEGNPDDKKVNVPGAHISVFYVGKILHKDDGKQVIFDDKFKEEPFSFRLGLGEVVKGFEAGIHDMCVGEKRKITVPPQRGYGERGFGQLVPPNAWLVFEVELVDVRIESSKIETTCCYVPNSPFTIGLSVEVLVQGKPDGKIAVPGLTIGVRYTGKLLKNDVVFSEIYKKTPVRFKVGDQKVTKGLDLGVAYMRVGEKRKITVPPSLGYCEWGDGGLVPPHAWLVFEAELVDVRVPRYLLGDPLYNGANQLQFASRPTS